LNVEYLVLIDAKEPFCKSVDTFSNLLRAYDGIKIKDDKITFSKCTFGYDVSFEHVEGATQRYFHLTLSLTDSDEEEKFSELLKLLKTILYKICGRQPEILWDDISSKRCEEAYPVIHETENLLRKLITKFMFANLGLKWTKEAVPIEVNNSIKAKKSEGEPQSNETKKHTNKVGNYLYQLDFIQLSKLLFKEYSTGNLTQINKKIAKASSIENLDIEELKELVPQSNWQRYFSPIVDCESSFLEKKWGRLYELRCNVAHNRFITRDELDEIKNSTKEVNSVLVEAIQKLKQVNVTDIQREEVAENLISTSNEAFSEFIEKWDKLEGSLLELLRYDPNSDKEQIDKLSDWKEIIDFASSNTYLGESFFEKIGKLYNFKYEAVHRPDFEATASIISEQVSIIKMLEDEIFETMECIAISWTRSRGGC